MNDSHMPSLQSEPIAISLLARRNFLQLTGSVVATSAALGPFISANAIAHTTTDVRTTLPTTIGVAIAGGEFGTDSATFSNRQPGTLGRDYLYPSETTINALADRGIRRFRIPMRWERLQPDLNEPLSYRELRCIDVLLKCIAKRKGQAILDLHNYGRYQLHTASGPRSIRIDERINGTTPVTSVQFAGFWSELATRYAGHPGLQGYGLMNEPHTMGDSNWKQISQKAVTQIRKIDSTSWIFVAGNDWSSAERFETANGADDWIRDPSSRTAYEAHCYFDSDGSGKYSKSFDQEIRLDPELLSRPVLRLASFARWCERNQVQGFLGEFGVPVTDPRWNQLLQRFLVELRQRELPGCMWAAGDWWGDYPLSVQPKGKVTNDSLALKLLQQFC
jgi:endoglucanase